MSTTINLDESKQIQSFLDELWDAYYSKRDLDKVCSMVADNIVSVGLSDREIGRNKKDFKKVVKRQITEVPDPIQYFISDSVHTNFGNHIWNCFTKIGLRVIAGDWGIIRYVVRITITLSLIEGQWKICCMHCSESTEAYGKKSPFLFTAELDKVSDQTTPLSQQQIGNVMNHLIPGGIISRTSIHNYPVVIANKQFIKMMGYSDFEDYMDGCEGLYINQIHPDDLEKFLYIAKFIYNTGKQCECEYRLRRKDDSYLWVHDIGRRAISTEGKELLISIITDISKQTEHLQKIELENGRDFLTKIYNRRGFLDQIKKLENQYKYCFICIIDVDYFKNINDLYNHLTGDRILEYTAKILTEAFHHNAYVARIGGDEFSIFIPDFKSLDEIKRKLIQISNKYKDYVIETCPNSFSSISIGGIYGSEKLSMQEKYEKADANLYHVKNNNKGNILITCFDSNHE